MDCNTKRFFTYSTCIYFHAFGGLCIRKSRRVRSASRPSINVIKGTHCFMNKVTTQTSMNEKEGVILVLSHKTSRSLIFTKSFAFNSEFPFARCGFRKKIAKTRGYSESRISGGPLFSTLFNV